MGQIESESKLKVEVGVDTDKIKQNKELEEANELMQLEIGKIRELRVKLDGDAHIVRTTGGQSMEKINCYNSIMMARAWFREAMEYGGEEPLNFKLLNATTDIQVDDDRSEPIKVQVIKKEGNKAEQKVDANDIQSLAHVKMDLGNITNNVAVLTILTDTVYETFIFQHLREATFWVDRELFRLHEESKKNLYSQTAQGKRQLPKRPEKKKPIISGVRQGQSRDNVRTLSGGMVSKDEPKKTDK